ncbi:MAG: hypothetical protein HXS48_00465 [Theionarchaea archaeon]|nr:hypothetical protein [Theionarchaea archaeon]
MDVKDEKIDSRELQEDIQRNIEEIPDNKPDYVPESPELRKGDVGHAENFEKTYYEAVPECPSALRYAVGKKGMIQIF